ncbi:MAG TPA: hypothetical protein VLV76_22410 [Candidatus Acidoferrum sp.]|nr:hypothetical protein [Candidatus Acidoferrum sp.]
MSRKVIAVAAAGLLAACATEEHYNRMLAAWVGRPLDELIVIWGPPDKQAHLSRGGKVVEYDRRRIVTTGGYTRYEPVHTEDETIWIPVEVPSRERHLQCATRFVVSPADIIESWSHDGNDCVASPPNS